MGNKRHLRRFFRLLQNYKAARLMLKANNSEQRGLASRWDVSRTVSETGAASPALSDIPTQRSLTCWYQSPACCRLPVASDVDHLVPHFSPVQGRCFTLMFVCLKMHHALEFEKLLLRVFFFTPFQNQYSVVCHVGGFISYINVQVSFQSYLIFYSMLRGRDMKRKVMGCRAM